MLLSPMVPSSNFLGLEGSSEPAGRSRRVIFGFSMLWLVLLQSAPLSCLDHACNNANHWSGYDKILIIVAFDQFETKRGTGDVNLAFLHVFKISFLVSLNQPQSIWTHGRHLYNPCGFRVPQPGV